MLLLLLTPIPVALCWLRGHYCKHSTHRHSSRREQHWTHRHGRHMRAGQLERQPSLGKLTLPLLLLHSRCHRYHHHP